MALIGMDFAAVTAERLRTEVVERGSRLLLDSAVRGSVGAIGLQPDSPLLQAADGTWMVSEVEAIVGHRKAHYSVRDAGGVEFATAWPQGKRVLIELGSERLTWESPSLLQWSYRIQGLFVARTGLRTIGIDSSSAARRVRRPFRVEVTPALAGRPEASLILLLATWLAWWDFASRAGAD
jgi:hypothetical protein